LTFHFDLVYAVQVPLKTGWSVSAFCCSRRCS